MHDKTPEQNALLVELKQVIMKRGTSDAPLQQIPANEDASLQIPVNEDAPFQIATRVFPRKKK